MSGTLPPPPQRSSADTGSYLIPKTIPFLILCVPKLAPQGSEWHVSDMSPAGVRPAAPDPSRAAPWASAPACLAGGGTFSFSVFKGPKRLCSQGLAKWNESVTQDRPRRGDAPASGEQRPPGSHVPTAVWLAGQEPGTPGRRLHSREEPPAATFPPPLTRGECGYGGR